MLDWDELDPARVERVAQMLLRDVFGATSIDGAGGDRAQDLRWESPAGLVIFEVKSFSKRLAGSQRSQVKKSLLRAVELHAPARWVLVTRSNPRAPELDWLQGLGQLVPGVALDWFGRDWLDLHVAGREDLISYVEGEDYKLLRRARALDHERAAAGGGEVLAERMGHLLDRGDDISPYWRWEFTSVGGQRAQVLAAKRPEAAEADSITLEPVFAFPTDDAEAETTAAQLRETLRVGGDVTVPDRFVQSLSVTASSAATQRLLGPPQRASTNLRIVSVPDTTGLPLRCTLIRPGGRASADVAVEVFFHTRLTGAEGVTLLGEDVSGALSLKLVVHGPADSPQGRLDVNLGDLVGRLPHEVLPALTLLAWAQPGDSIELRRGPALLSSFDTPTAWPTELRPVARFVAALDILQSHVGELIEVPDGALDGQALRAMLDVAAALTGARVRQACTGLEATVKPGMIRSFLDQVPSEGGALYCTSDHLLDVAGRAVVVPGLATWAPKVQLQNREALEAAVLASVDSEQVATFVPFEDEFIYLIRAVDGAPGESWRPLSELSP